MTEALLRSGYLMESRVAGALAREGYLIEPNQRVKDPVTQKDREIDLIAEMWDPDWEPNRKYQVSTDVRFVCEMKNYLLPTVLMTEVESSPGIETWESLRQWKTGIPARDSSEPDFFNFLYPEQVFFSQYCSFRTKDPKNQTGWFAEHPEDLHSAIQVLIQYCDAQGVREGTPEDKWHRIHLHLPVVILSGELYVARPTPRSLRLTSVDVAHYLHFYIQDGQQACIAIPFVRERALKKYFGTVVEAARVIKATIINDIKAAQPGVVADRSRLQEGYRSRAEAKAGPKAPASAPAAKRNVMRGRKK